MVILLPFFSKSQTDYVHNLLKVFTSTLLRVSDLNKDDIRPIVTDAEIKSRISKIAITLIIDHSPKFEAGKLLS